MFAKLINEAIDRTAQEFVEIGDVIRRAKAELTKDDFNVLLDHDLRCGRRTAEMLAKIAQHPILANAKHASHLPTSWYTLVVLARLSPPELVQAIEEGAVTPATERKDAERLVRATHPPTTRATTDKVVEETPDQTGPDVAELVADAAKDGQPRATKKATGALYRALVKLEQEFGQLAEFVPIADRVGDLQTYLSDIMAANEKVKVKATRTGRWECPDCGEITDTENAELVVIRQCSNESCDTVFNGDENGQACPECNRTFTRRLHDFGCPECGTNEEECVEIAEDQDHQAEAQP